LIDRRIRSLALTMGVEPYSFSPFTDANDDFAVLEWMRGDDDGPETPQWRVFKDFFIEVTGDWNIWNYQIGDFARAALKVIDNAESAYD